MYCSICRNVAETHPIATPCGHIYHEHCILECIRSGMKADFLADDEVPCPICREIVTEDDWTRLYPGSGEQRTQETQTEPSASIPHQSFLILDSRFRNFVRRILYQKWEAEAEVGTLRIQKKDLEYQVMKLCEQNLRQDLALELAHEIMHSDSVQKFPETLSSKKRNSGAEEKKRNIWQKMFRFLVHPGYGN